jgi:cell division protease FtsH
MAVRREFSEATAETVDRAVRALLDQAHAGVVSSLTARRPVLEALAKLLMEHEVVDRTMLLTLLETPAPSDARVGPPLVAHR